MNYIIIAGNLGRDVELKEAGTSKVATFSVATKRLKRGGEGVDWHQVNAWNVEGERCHQYLRKGSEVVVHGRMEYQSWTDPEGNKKSRPVIQADRVHFCGGRSKGADGGSQQSRQGSDEIPF
tara:strand:+ start:6423 stop:6788 length:366 start_codon:yes stop_codon:yes gene_type:complete